MRLPFAQVDVFSSVPLKGNPLAVVQLEEPVSQNVMQALASWTNLSETVFLLPPGRAGADYTLRIFTPRQELLFAGHPTLGAAAVWIAAHKASAREEVVQDCAAGLVRIKAVGDVLAFEAPVLRKDDGLSTAETTTLAHAIGLTGDDVIAGAWVDNGPGWRALLLRDHAQLVAARPDYAALGGQRLGLVAPHPDADLAFELRAFSASGFEDPVTGSLQAGVAQWLLHAGFTPGRAWQTTQGRALGRDGRVFVTCDDDAVWIGGHVCPVVDGMIDLPA